LLAFIFVSGAALVEAVALPQKALSEAVALQWCPAVHSSSCVMEKYCRMMRDESYMM
jgi:hypothetical protein